MKPISSAVTANMASETWETLPNSTSRTPSLAVLELAGGRATRLLLGTIPMLVIAGVIEGFFSPSAAPMGMKFALGAVLFAALITYLFFTSAIPTISKANFAL